MFQPAIALALVVALGLAGAKFTGVASAVSSPLPEPISVSVAPSADMPQPLSVAAPPGRGD